MQIRNMIEIRNLNRTYAVINFWINYISIIIHLSLFYLSADQINNQSKIQSTPPPHFVARRRALEPRAPRSVPSARGHRRWQSHRSPWRDGGAPHGASSSPKRLGEQGWTRRWVGTDGPWMVLTWRRSIWVVDDSEEENRRWSMVDGPAKAEMKR